MLFGAVNDDDGGGGGGGDDFDVVYNVFTLCDSYLLFPAIRRDV